MFNRNDFPDHMTEAAVTRERHGPPPFTPEELEAREATRREAARKIVNLRDAGASLPQIVAALPGETLYHVRRIIAESNFQQQFPDSPAVGAFYRMLDRDLCDHCRNIYLSGPWRNWAIGKRLTFPPLPACLHPRPAGDGHSPP
jgi:hypothetical protein